MEEKQKKAFITFNDKMIASVRPHSMGKQDINTGEVMMIASVRLPSVDYRTHRFGKDANGIDRDDREATINVVNSYIFDNKDENGNVINHFTYLDPERDYNINFKGKIIGQENGKNIFDKPERATLTGEELTNLFKEARQISKEKKEQAREKETGEKEKKETAKSKTTKDKAKTTKKPTKEKSAPTR